MANKIREETKGVISHDTRVRMNAKQAAVIPLRAWVRTVEVVIMVGEGFENRRVWGPPH